MEAEIARLAAERDALGAAYDQSLAVVQALEAQVQQATEFANQQATASIAALQVETDAFKAQTEAQLAALTSRNIAQSSRVLELESEVATQASLVLAAQKSRTDAMQAASTRHRELEADKAALGQRNDALALELKTTQGALSSAKEALQGKTLLVEQQDKTLKQLKASHASTTADLSARDGEIARLHAASQHAAAQHAAEMQALQLALTAMQAARDSAARLAIERETEARTASALAGQLSSEAQNLKQEVALLQATIEKSEMTLLDSRVGEAKTAERYGDLVQMLKEHAAADRAKHAQESAEYIAAIGQLKATLETERTAMQNRDEEMGRELSYLHSRYLRHVAGFDTVEMENLVEGAPAKVMAIEKCSYQKEVEWERAQAASAKEALLGVKSDAAALLERVAELEAKLAGATAALDDQRARARVELAAATQESIDSQHRARAAATEMEHELAQALERLAVLAAEASAATKRVEIVSRQRDQDVQHFEALSLKTADVHAQQRAALQAIIDSQTVALATAVEKHQTDNARHELALASLHAELSSTQTRNSDLNKELLDTLATLASTKSLYLELQQAFGVAQISQQTLNDEILKHKAGLEAERSKLEAHSEQTATDSEALERLTAMVDQLQRQWTAHCTGADVSGDQCKAHHTLQLERERIAQLEFRLTQLNKEHEALQHAAAANAGKDESLARALQALAQTQEQHSAAREEVAELTRRDVEQQAVKQGLRHHARQAQDLVEQQATELAQRRQQLAECKEELTSTRQQLVESQAATTTATTAARRADAQLALVTAQAAQLRSQHAVALEATSAAEGRATKLHHALLALRAENDAAMLQWQSNDAALASAHALALGRLEQQLAELRREATASHPPAVTPATAIVVAADDHTAKEREARLQSECDNLRDELAAMRSDLAKLRDDAAQLQIALAAKSAALASAAEEATLAARVTAAALAEKEQAHQVIVADTVKVMADRHAAEVASVQQNGKRAVADLAQKCDALEADLAREKRARADAELSVSAAKARTAEAETALRVQQWKHTADAAVTDEKLAALQRKLDDGVGAANALEVAVLAQTVAALEADLSSARRVLALVEGELDDLRVENARLRSQQPFVVAPSATPTVIDAVLLASAKAENLGLVAECTLLKDSLEMSGKENASLRSQMTQVRALLDDTEDQLHFAKVRLANSRESADLEAALGREIARVHALQQDNAQLTAQLQGLQANLLTRSVESAPVSPFGTASPRSHAASWSTSAKAEAEATIAALQSEVAVLRARHPKSVAAVVDDVLGSQAALQAQLALQAEEIAWLEAETEVLQTGTLSPERAASVRKNRLASASFRSTRSGSSAGGAVMSPKTEVDGHGPGLWLGSVE